MKFVEKYEILQCRGEAAENAEEFSKSEPEAVENLRTENKLVSLRSFNKFATPERLRGNSRGKKHLGN